MKRQRSKMKEGLALSSMVDQVVLGYVRLLRFVMEVSPVVLPAFMEAASRLSHIHRGMVCLRV